jgi:hypothetical protein
MVMLIRLGRIVRARWLATARTARVMVVMHRSTAVAMRISGSVLTLARAWGPSPRVRLQCGLLPVKGGRVDPGCTDRASVRPGTDDRRFRYLSAGDFPGICGPCEQ